MINNTCDKCNGNFEVECEGCKKIVDDKQTARYASCATCHGKRKVPCPKCKGKGTI